MRVWRTWRKLVSSALSELQILHDPNRDHVTKEAVTETQTLEVQIGSRLAVVKGARKIWANDAKTGKGSYLQLCTAQLWTVLEICDGERGGCSLVLERQGLKIRLYTSARGKLKHPEFNLNTGDPTVFVRFYCAKPPEVAPCQDAEIGLCGVLGSQGRTAAASIENSVAVAKRPFARVSGPVPPGQVLEAIDHAARNAQSLERGLLPGQRHTEEPRK